MAGGLGGAGGGIGGGLGGGIANLAILLGAGGKGGSEWYKRATQVIQDIQDPQFDFSKLSFEDLQMVAEMAPQLYNAVVPDEVKVAADSPELRQAQQRGLARLEQTATEGYSTPERIAAQEAGRSISREGTRLRDAALSQLAQRGRAYGGDVLNFQLGANQQAMELARAQGADLLRYGSDRMANANQAFIGAAGNMRAQDFGQRQAAVDAINRFNEYKASAQTQAAAANAAARQQAQAYNVGTMQGLQTQTQLGRYGNQQYNQQNYNSLQNTLANFRALKANALANAYQQRGEQADVDRLNKERAIQGVGSGFGSALGGGIGGLL